MSHVWKTVSVNDYYRSGNYDNQNLPTYLICKNCGAKAKRYKDIPILHFDDDSLYENNFENEWLTCNEIIIKNIIE